MIEFKIKINQRQEQITVQKVVINPGFISVDYDGAPALERSLA